MPGKDSTDQSGNPVSPSEQPTESISQPTSVIPFNVDPPSTSATNPAGGVPPTDPPAAPPAGGPGSGGPGSGGPGNGGPAATGGMFSSNWARLAALVGGIVVAVMLIGGGSIAVAAATGNLDNGREHRQSDRRGDGAGRGFGNDGPRGYMGRDRGNSGGPDQGIPGQSGQGRAGGQGGLMGMLPGAIGGVEHGDFTMQGADGKAVTMRMVRGTVADVTAKAITVKASDGYTVAYALNSTTKVSRNGASVAAGSVVKGDTAIALGSVTGKTVTATRIVVTSAAQ
ncbi:MAG: hypothetical protein ACOYD0_03315 [Candidatus Nanopelagicales bacterium]